MYINLFHYDVHIFEYNYIIILGIKQIGEQKKIFYFKCHAIQS